jgi:hypothetical protein
MSIPNGTLFNNASGTAYAAWLETLIESLVNTKGNLGVLFNRLSTKVQAPDPDITNWNTVQAYQLQEVANNLESMRASLAGDEAKPPFPEG